MGLVFTYLLTYGGAAVALFKPHVGVLIYVCFAILKPEALWPWAVPTGNYSRIIAIALVIGWGAQGFGGWQLGKARGIVIAFIGFWLWSILCASNAPNGVKAWHFVEETGKILLPFIVGVTTIDSLPKLKQLIWVIVLSQGFLAYEANLIYYTGYNMVHHQGFAGLTDNNGVALTMHTGLPLAFFLGLNTVGWWRKGIAFTACGLMAHAVLFSFSREGMLGMLTSMVLIFVLIPKRPRDYLIFAAALLLSLRLAGPEVQNRFQTIFFTAEARDESAQGRLELWDNCIQLMVAHPILGVGPDHFSLVSFQFGWPVGKEAHTLWLKIGAEMGFVGLGFFAAFYGLCWIRQWPLVRTATAPADPWLRGAASMVLASLGGFAVCTQFNNMYGVEIPYYVAMLGAVTLKLVPCAGRVSEVPGFVHLGRGEEVFADQGGIFPRTCGKSSQLQPNSEAAP